MKQATPIESAIVRTMALLESLGPGIAPLRMPHPDERMRPENVFAHAKFLMDLVRKHSEGGTTREAENLLFFVHGMLLSHGCCTTKQIDELKKPVFIATPR